MMKHIHYPVYLLVLLCIIASCNSGHPSGSTYNQEVLDDDSALPYGVTDTIGGEKVSVDCAIIHSALERMLYQAEQLASPSMLMTFRAKYDSRIAEAMEGFETLSSDEQGKLKATKDSIDIILRQQCRKLAVPATGVLQTLEDCIRQVKKANSKKDMLIFIGDWRSTIYSLDEIHLCIEEASPQIAKVKRLAKQLKDDIEKKKAMYGIE